MIDPLRDRLKSAKLIVTAGCGGVGKTTVAAALSLRAAHLGRRVAVLTIDPAKRLAQALGLSELNHELKRVPTNGKNTGELWAMMLDTKAAGDNMVLRFSQDENVAKGILNNRYYGYFSSSLAGTLEYMAVEQVRVLMDEHDFDLVVLDTPPAAHALDFFDAPDRLVDGLMKIPLNALDGRGRKSISSRLASQGRQIVLRGLNRLTGGPFLDDLTEFLSQFRSILGALQEAGEQVRDLLRADGTSFFLITAPSAPRIEDAIAFFGELERRKLPVGGIIVNRVHREIIHNKNSAVSASRLAAAWHEASLEKRTMTEYNGLVARLTSTLMEHNQRARQDALVCDQLSLRTQQAQFIAPRLNSGLGTQSELLELANQIQIYESGTSL
ncbi:MAG: ArsA-related P-loop ATPase [Myxococcota bacterium]|nr:ArsA-related P-loop ATPase [Myxococcota bacterium]